jgi:hypothetical protein
MMGNNCFLLPFGGAGAHIAYGRASFIETRVTLYALLVRQKKLSEAYTR